jgi:putative FmdB family regulatory protein
MPLYDVQCSACAHEFEDFQTMDAKQPVRCEKCGRKKARRVLIKPCATYNKYSPMHPRKKRGSGIGRKTN